MTPEQIAKALTPAQVRALRYFANQTSPHSAHYHGFAGSTAYRLEIKGLVVIKRGVPPMATLRSPATITDLGRAVLAELDKAPAPQREDE